LASWDTDETIRKKHNLSYINLLSIARDTLLPEGLDLWVDCPLKFLLPEHTLLLSQVSEIADGVTFMVYLDSPNRIVNAALKIPDAFEKPFEVGIELSENAISEETLSRISLESLEMLKNTIKCQSSTLPGFRGISYHDDSAVKHFLSREPVSITDGN